jgi:hypothetical protein
LKRQWVCWEQHRNWFRVADLKPSKFTIKYLKENASPFEALFPVQSECNSEGVPRVQIYSRLTTLL